MPKKLLRGWVRGLLILSVSLIMNGCSRSVETRDKLEERDPLLKRAQLLKGAQDSDGAIEMYNKALDRKPALARAHLELGLLYDQREDYIRAIYHYQRYLELRPQTEKRKLIEDLIRHARLSFAATLPDQPSGAIEEISMLKKEIESLKAQGAMKSRAPAGGSAPAPVAAKPAVPTPKPEPAQPQVQTYTVQVGDSLSSIAIKMYRDQSKWKLIYEANRGTLPSPESVKVGQTLIIPRS